MADVAYTTLRPLRARVSKASADESGPGTLEVLAIRTCPAVRTRAVVYRSREAPERRDISFFRRRPHDKTALRSSARRPRG